MKIVKMLYMEENKVAIISDLHIGNNKDSEIFHKILLDYAQWLKNKLKDNNITRLIIAGDFFHDRTKIPLTTLDVGHKFLDILSDLHITITTGNHDSYYLDNSSVNSLSIFKNRKNVEIIDTLTIKDGFTYCPWGITLDEISDNSNIVICHIDAQSFEVSKGKISTHGFKVADLMQKCNICFSGHYHKNQSRVYNGKSFHYLGSPMQLNFCESGDEKYIHILNVDTLEVSKIVNDFY